MSGEGETISAEQYRALQNVKRSKFGNVKTEVDGITFDSKAEASRFGELKLMELAGVILDVECQPRYELVVNGVKISRYTGDFRYMTREGDIVVEDVKAGPTKTRAYVLRKKLVKALYGIDVTEVES